MVRITTWNVNGIRNPFGYQPWRETRTFAAMFDILEADIVIMQELKIQRKDLTDDMVLVPGWDCYFSLPKHKKGYSGVGIYTRQSVCVPIRAEEGLLGVLCPPDSSTPYRELPEDARIGGYPALSHVTDLGVDPVALDAEGRCLVLEFPAFVLFGVYSPANSNGLRDDFRYGFITALDTRIRNLTKMGKNVILTGDLNVSRDLIDTAKAEESIRSEGMTHDEYLSTPNRRIFNQLLFNGKVPGKRDEGREEPVLYDLCREFHPKREGMFTHWEQKINARPGNFGSRIDFVLCSIAMKDWFSEANIQEGLMGSDHCPVYAVTKEIVPTLQLGDASTFRAEGKTETHVLDLMNPPGMFKDGIRLQEYDPTKDIPPLSGRLLPEFTKRRNIRDMFSKKPVLSKTSISTRSALVTKPQVPDEVEAPLSTPAVTLPVDKEPPSSAETHSTQGSHVANGANQTSPGPRKSPEKRRVSASASPSKPVKRSKSNLVGSAIPSTSLGKGQKSLKGFFQSRSKPEEPVSNMSSTALLTFPPPLPSPLPPSPSQDASQPTPPTISLPSPINEPCDPLASQQHTKETWTKLFSRRPPPRCESHAEPCITLTTKKPGVNCGRQFFICPRPIGPSGQKETGTQWRCGTFIWASDWKG